MFVFISPTHQLCYVASSASINRWCNGGTTGDLILRAGEVELCPSPLNEPPTTSLFDSKEDLPPPPISKNLSPLPTNLQPQHSSSKSEIELGSETKYVWCSLFLDPHNPTNTSVSCTTSAPNTPRRSLSFTWICMQPQGMCATMIDQICELLCCLHPPPCCCWVGFQEVMEGTNKWFSW